MLVLTRKAGETINVDGDIVIQIVEIRGRQVRVGIEAPKSRKVQRGELIARAHPFKKALLSKEIPPSVKTL